MEVDEQFMIWSHTSALIPSIVLGFLAGGLLGVFYFGALRQTAIAIVNSQPLLLIGGLFLVRLSVLLIIIWCAIRFGAVPLIALTLGMIATRTWMLRRSKRADVK